jgi:hypothetical protein
MGLAVVQGFKHKRPTSEESSCGRSTKHILIKEGHPVQTFALGAHGTGSGAVRVPQQHTRAHDAQTPPPHRSARVMASTLGALHVPGRGVG